MWFWGVSFSGLGPKNSGVPILGFTYSRVYDCNVQIHQQTLASFTVFLVLVLVDFLFFSFLPFRFFVWHLLGIIPKSVSQTSMCE